MSAQPPHPPAMKHIEINPSKTSKSEVPTKSAATVDSQNRRTWNNDHFSKRAPGTKVTPANRTKETLALRMVLIASWFCLIAGFSLVGHNASAERILLGQASVCIVSLIVLYYGFCHIRVGRWALVILLAGFGARAVACILNYTLAADPHYWMNPSSFIGIADFEWMHNSIITVSEHWAEKGFGSLLPTEFFETNRNALLMHYLAIPSYANGIITVSMAVWDAWHHMITSAIILALARMHGANRRLGRERFFPAWFCGWPCLGT
jgi:hypothetical protein